MRLDRDFGARNALISENSHRVNLLITRGEAPDRCYTCQWDRGGDTVSAEAVSLSPMDPYTVEDWLAEDPPPDGSKRELILGKIRVSPFASTGHNAVGDAL